MHNFGIAPDFFGELSPKQWCVIWCLMTINMVRMVFSVIVFIRDVSCTLDGYVFVSCPPHWIGLGPEAELVLSIIESVHYATLFYLFWYWNALFEGTLCEMRFHLNPRQLLSGGRALHTLKKLYVRQLTVFEFFTMWAAAVGFLYMIILADGDSSIHYALPFTMSLSLLLEIFAVVPMNFSAPQKFGAARYIWFFSILSVVLSSALSSTFYSLLVALKVYDPSFYSSKGLHALLLVLGALVVNFRLSIFYIVRRKMWNPKANGLMPNLKSSQGHFMDQVSSDITGAFIYASSEASSMALIQPKQGEQVDRFLMSHTYTGYHYGSDVTEQHAGEMQSTAPGTPKAVPIMGRLPATVDDEVAHHELAARTGKSFIMRNIDV